MAIRKLVVDRAHKAAAFPSQLWLKWFLEMRLRGVHLQLFTSCSPCRSCPTLVVPERRSQYTWTTSMLNLSAIYPRSKLKNYLDWRGTHPRAVRVDEVVA